MGFRWANFFGLLWKVPTNSLTQFRRVVGRANVLLCIVHDLCALHVYFKSTNEEAMLSQGTNFKRLSLLHTLLDVLGAVSVFSKFLQNVRTA